MTKMTKEHLARTLVRDLKRVAPWSDMVDAHDLQDVRIEGNFDMLKLANITLGYMEPKSRGVFYVDDLPCGAVTDWYDDPIKGKDVAG